SIEAVRVARARRHLAILHHAEERVRGELRMRERLREDAEKRLRVEPIPARLDDASRRTFYRASSLGRVETRSPEMPRTETRRTRSTSKMTIDSSNGKASCALESLTSGGCSRVTDSVLSLGSYGQTTSEP